MREIRNGEDKRQTEQSKREHCAPLILGHRCQGQCIHAGPIYGLGSVIFLTYGAWFAGLKEREQPHCTFVFTRPVKLVRASPRSKVRIRAEAETASGTLAGMHPNPTPPLDFAHQCEIEPRWHVR